MSFNAGCELIAEGLAVNRTLITLDLSKNKISDMGALALAEALHTNTTLKELQLNGNSIGAICSASNASTARFNYGAAEVLTRFVFDSNRTLSSRTVSKLCCCTWQAEDCMIHLPYVFSLPSMMV